MICILTNAKTETLNNVLPVVKLAIARFEFKDDYEYEFSLLRTRFKFVGRKFFEVRVLRTTLAARRFSLSERQNRRGKTSGTGLWHTLLITLKTRGSPPYFTAAYRKQKEIFVLCSKSAQCLQGIGSTDHFTDVRLVAWPLNENAALKANSMIIHTSSCPYSTLNTRGHKGHGLVALLFLGGEARTSKFVMLLAFCVKGTKSQSTKASSRFPVEIKLQRTIFGPQTAIQPKNPFHCTKIWYQPSR